MLRAGDEACVLKSAAGTIYLSDKSSYEINRIARTITGRKSWHIDEPANHRLRRRISESGARGYGIDFSGFLPNFGGIAMMLRIARENVPILVCLAAPYTDLVERQQVYARCLNRSIQTFLADHVAVRGMAT
jgi:DNA-binding IclR family transcriptional regulator